MKMMFSVLGEGRGHMTQAMAVKEMVENAGHEVAVVTLGVSSKREIPAFFSSAMKQTRVEQLPTLEFKYRNNRSVSNTATLASAVSISRTFSGALKLTKGSFAKAPCGVRGSICVESDTVAITVTDYL